MHARLLRPALSLLLAGTAVLALPAGAAGKALVVEDVVGDGNAISDQGTDQGVSHVVTPVQYAPGDIVRATLANTWSGRRCTGFTLTMELSGPVDPSAPLIYRLMARTTVNDGRFQVYLDNSPAGSGAVLRYGKDEPGDFPFVDYDDNSVPLATPAQVVGSRIVFTVTAREIAAIGDRPGSKITDIEYDVRGSNGTTFAPLVDQVATDKSFTMCA